MKKNKSFGLILGTGLIALSTFSFGINKSDNTRSLDQREVSDIVLNDSNEFKPLSSGDDVAVITANDPSQFDGGGYIGEWGNVYRDANNGKFTFNLGSSFDEILIDQYVGFNGRYDEYYSFIDIAFPLPGNALTNSKEVFHFKGDVTKGETVKVSEGDVIVILDTWGSDNYGYKTVEWYMNLSNDGTQLTFYTPESSYDQWGSGEPTWTIDQMYSIVNAEDMQEYHNKIGNGAPYYHWYDSSSPEYVENPTLEVYGINY